MKDFLLMKMLHLFTTGILMSFFQVSSVYAQSEADMKLLPLQDLTAFRPQADNWRIVGDVMADRNQKEAIKPSAGQGVLVNVPTEKKRSNLLTQLEHGDLDLELEFMMVKGSNSGIYLQGRYEVQLFDSWGTKNPSAYDCGAVYERWDESKPEGQKGYEGHPPRVNVSRAPGLWQHLRISFQAPRFNAQGLKVQNAKLLEVIHNGVVIQQNVDLSGATRSSLADNEVAAGPLMLQGDHGPVAFRNIRYNNYNQAPLALSNLRYSYYPKFDRSPDFDKLKPSAEGTTPDLTWEVSPTPNDFVLRFTGILAIKEPGKYTFTLVNGGNGQLKISNQPVVALDKRERTGSLTLAAGQQPVEIVYTKAESWVNPSLGLYVSGPGLRRHPLHLMSSVPQTNPVDPILLEANATEPTLLRSFMDFQPHEGAKSKRITHAISVGSSFNTHYTVDLDNSALVQVWKGGFLDATPMWHDRGDGSSRPQGSLVFLNDAPVMQVLGTSSTAWSDTLASPTDFRFRGYDIDENGRPVFKYTLYGTDVEDLTVPEENGKILTRTLRINGTTPANLYVRIAEGKTLSSLSDGSYSVNGNEYYVKVDATSGKATLRTVNNRQELLVPVNATTGKVTNVKYSIIW